MLKTLSTKSVEPRKSEVGVGGDSRARRDGSEIDRSGMDDIEVDSGEVGDDKVVKKDRKTSKSKNLFKSKKMVGSAFFIPKVRLEFTELKQAFFKAPIFHHFDPKRHIRIEIDASGHAIDGVLSQLTSDNLGQWYLVAFFSQKMIPAEIRYETHNNELLAIIEDFKTWRYYLEGSQHEVLVLIGHNNLRQFMDIKSLSSRQVC